MGPRRAPAHARHHGEGGSLNAERHDATLVVVSYRTSEIDLRWWPHDAEVIVVENDDGLREVQATGDVTRVTSTNVGFGAAVNKAAALATGRRLVLCNPDLDATREHYDVLVSADDDEIVTVPVIDCDGERTSVVSPYPTPLSLVLTGFRFGRLFPRGSCGRNALTALLGRWGRRHRQLMGTDVGRWPLTSAWASGALVSLPARRFQDVGGFDERYFLYLEDVDLCARLGARFGDMVVRLAMAPPAVHAVSASSVGDARRATDIHYAESTRTWARSQPGIAWKAADAILGLRIAYLRRRS